MKKWYRIELILLVLLILSACSSEEVPTPEPFPNENYVYNPDSVSDIAKAFVNLQPDIEMCREVHAATQKAISLGLDESYYFVEMFGKGEKITKTSEIQRQILSKLESLSDTNNIKQLFASVSSDSHYLRHYQIYWPYSQSWDGNTLPVITFKIKESPSIRQDSNIGYRFINGNVEEVRVDDDYAQMYPVWIINYNPVPYEEYPDFAQQNWVSKIFDLYDFLGGYKKEEVLIPKFTIYAKENKSLDNIPDYANKKNVDIRNDTLSLYLKTVSFDKKEPRLHSLFAGGAHYIFNIQVTDINDINYKEYSKSTLENLYKLYYKIEVVGIRFVYLRSEMTEGNEKILDSLLSWRWLPYENSFPVTLIQEFGGDEYIFVEDILGYTSCVFYHFTEEREPNIGYSSATCDFFDFVPLQINDELLCHYDYARYPGGIYTDNMFYYDNNIVENNFSCEFGVTKGISIPAWYIPMSNQ